MGKTGMFRTFALIAAGVIWTPLLLGGGCTQQFVDGQTLVGGVSQCPAGESLVNGVCTAPSTLTGLWTVPISGDVTFSSILDGILPPNPNPLTDNRVARVNTSRQLVFSDSGLPTTLPLATSGFTFGIPAQAVTAFKVGETQTIASNLDTRTSPIGATDTTTDHSSSTITLTVVESEISASHFRVVYATTNVDADTITGTAPGFVTMTQTISSDGTLTYEATASDGVVSFSMEFNNAATINVTGTSPITGNGTITGKLQGTLGKN
jgi:hypothetical protein